MKTKSNIMVALTIIAVGLVSFISGRVSKSEVSAVSAVPVVEKGISGQNLPASVGESQVGASSGTVTSAPTTVSSGEGAFVASKNGEKYFPVGCGSAKTIKPENAMYFATAAEAEAAGKTQSVQCKY